MHHPGMLLLTLLGFALSHTAYSANTTTGNTTATTNATVNTTTTTAPISSCGIDATPGIQGTNAIWQEFKPVKGAFNEKWDMRFIPDSVQGRNASNFQECNCRCSSVSTCVGYAWLGAQDPQCWLFSFLVWWAPTVGDYIDPMLPSDHNVMSVELDSVLGRVVNGSQWQTCSAVNALANQTWSSQMVLATTEEFANPASQCNSACGANPLCVAYMWQGQDMSSPAKCLLMQQVQGPLAPLLPNKIANTTYIAPFQSCSELRVAVQAPSPSPSPPSSSSSSTIPAAINVTTSPVPTPSPSPSPLASTKLHADILIVMVSTVLCCMLLTWLK